MTYTPTVVQCLSTAGVLVLDVSTGVYEAVVLPGDDETWDRVAIKSPWVRGDEEQNSTMDSLTLEMHIRIRDTTWPAIETARAALRTATSGSPRWLLRIVRGGMEEVWRCDRTSSTSPQPAYDVRNLRRDVFLRIPAQPTAARTVV